MRRAAWLLLLLALCWARPAPALTLDYAFRGAEAMQADGRHNLGVQNDGAGNRTPVNLFLDLAPRLMLQIDSRFTGYVRARVFLPTGRLAAYDTDEPNNPALTHGFAGLSELWLQFNGFTNYPGEALRLGRQRIKLADAEWWDDDVDSLRWVLQTTPMEADLGIAHQFSSYRTDSAAVSSEQRSRNFAYGHIDADWWGENRVGVRAVYSHAHAAPSPDPAQGSGTTSGSQWWVGLHADNGYYQPDAAHRLSYWAEVDHLGGQQVITPAGGGAAGSQSLDAYAGSAALRWLPSRRLPLQIGAAYTYSQGGEDGTRSHQYRQPGLQSNVSAFTGTDSLINRYNETLQAELGNLRVITGYVSLALEDDDASLVAEKFTRDDGSAPFIARNITARPVNSSRDIGTGVDLVLTHYFGDSLVQSRLLDNGEAMVDRPHRSLLRLHASMFRPGDAYGPEARNDYRLLLEGVLWIN